MIDLFSTDDFRRLADASDEYCISIYIPTHSSGSASTQNPIRLKNLLAQARAELEVLGWARRPIDALLADADAARDDPRFWASMGHGLAIFVNTDGMWTYRVQTPVDELVVVAERFHLKPMLSSVTTDEEFYILALSQSDVSLLRGDRFAMNEIPLGEIPASVPDAFPLDDRESQLQSHAGSRTGAGETVAVFHGQGAGKDAKKIDLDRFLIAVDKGFRHIVGAATPPLVLAGVEHVVSHFRKLSGYAHIVEGEIRGNPERLGPDELHNAAWPLVERILDASQRSALETVAAASLPTLSSLTQIVVRAADGRVESLIVPKGVQRWGTFSVEAQVAVEHEHRRPGDRDLLDIAAIDTLTHGGTVFVVSRADLPAHLPVAAILRY